MYYAIQYTNYLINMTNNVHGKVLIGKDFKNWIDQFTDERASIIIKRLAKNRKHYDYTYKSGLNILNKTFVSSGQCKDGGLYVTDDIHKDQYEGNGIEWRFVGIPDWALVYVESVEKSKCSCIYLDVEYKPSGSQYYMKQSSNQAFVNANAVSIDDNSLLHMARYGLFDPNYKPFMDRLLQLCANNINGINKMYIEKFPIESFISLLEQKKILFSNMNDNIIDRMSYQQFIHLLRTGIITFDQIKYSNIKQFTVNEVIELIEERYLTERIFDILIVKDKIKDISLEYWMKWIDNSVAFVTNMGDVIYTNNIGSKITVSHVPTNIAKIIPVDKWMEWLIMRKAHICHVPSNIHQQISLDQWISLVNKNIIKSRIMPKDVINNIQVEHWIAWMDKGKIGLWGYDVPDKYLDKITLSKWCEWIGQKKVKPIRLPMSLLNEINKDMWIYWLESKTLNYIDIPQDVKNIPSMKDINVKNVPSMKDINVKNVPSMKDINVKNVPSTKDINVNNAIITSNVNTNIDINNYETRYFNHSIRFKDIPDNARTFKMWRYRFEYKHENIYNIPYEYRQKILATTNRADMFDRIKNRLHLITIDV